MEIDSGYKFVVLTTNRSGSVWVMSTLNSFSGVTAQGELFLPRPRVPEKRWDWDIAIPRYIEKKSDGLNFRPFSVFEYLNSLYSMPGTVGFKLMYAQLGMYPEILAYLIRHRVRVVHLVRQNHLDVLISYALKAQLGKAHVLAGQKAPDDMRVNLETGNLVRRLTWLGTKQRIARMMLNWFRLPYIEIAYEDLLNDQIKFRHILDFLFIDHQDQSIRSTVVKIRKGGHREVISNYDQVKRVLKESKYAALIE